MSQSTQTYRWLRQLVVVPAIVLVALFSGGSGVDRGDAAVVRAYADGPVVFLNKGETVAAVRATAGGAAGLLSAWINPFAAGAVGAVIAGIADDAAIRNTNAGYCIQVKMWWWLPNHTRYSWYKWWPCY